MINDDSLVSLIDAIAPLLMRATLALTLGLFVVLSLRSTWRKLFGSRATLWLWWSVPLFLLLTVAPAPRQSLLGDSVLNALWQQPIVASAHSQREMTDVAPSITPTATVQAKQPRGDVAERPAVAANVEVAQRSPLFSDALMRLALLAAWAIGSLGMIAMLWRKQRQFERSLGRLRRVSRNLFRSSQGLTSPVLIGLLSPRIVLPADFEQRFNPEQQALVIAHERWHMRRLDLWVGLVSSALQSLFWFHPLLPFAARALRLDQELACDEAVLVQIPQGRGDYARALLESQLAAPGLPVGCFWQSSQPLKTRIVMISKPLPAMIRTRLGIALGAVASLSVLSAAWAAQPSAAPKSVAAAIQPAAPAPEADNRPVLAGSAASPNDTTPAVAPGAPTAATKVQPGVAPAAPAGTAAPATKVKPSDKTPAPTAMRTPAPPQPAAITRSGLPAASPLMFAAAEPAPRIAEPEEIKPPTLLEEAQLRWPSMYRHFRDQNYKDVDVVVAFTVTPDGRTEDLSIAKTEDSRFDLSALRAVEQWRFAPATRQDQPVAFRTKAVVRFSTNEHTEVNGINPVGPERVRQVRTPPSADRYGR